MKVWDIRQGHALYTLYAHERGANCVKVSQSGSLIVSGGADNNVIVWDANLIPRSRPDPEIREKSKISKKQSQEVECEPERD